MRLSQDILIKIVARGEEERKETQVTTDPAANVAPHLGVPTVTFRTFTTLVPVFIAIATHQRQQHQVEHT